MTTTSDPNVSSGELPFSADTMSTSIRWNRKLRSEKSWWIRWCLRGAVIAVIGLVVALSLNGYRKQAALISLLQKTGIVSTDEVWPLNHARKLGIASPPWFPKTIISAESRDESRISEFLDAVGRCQSLHVLRLRSKFLRDDEFQSLSRLTELDELIVELSPHYTGEGLRSLTQCRRLRFLTFDETSVSDAGIRHLKHFPNLLRLSLQDCQITDRSLIEITKLPKLYHLELSSPHLTAEGIQVLAACSSLKGLEFWHADPADDNPDPITPEAVMRLQTNMPWCVISDGNYY